MKRRKYERVTVKQIEGRVKDGVTGKSKESDNVLA